MTAIPDLSAHHHASPLPNAPRTALTAEPYLSYPSPAPPSNTMTARPHLNIT